MNQSYISYNTTKQIIDDVHSRMHNIKMDAQVSEEAAAKLTEKLKPNLRQVSRLRRRMKRDLLLKIEEEQQHISSKHIRNQSSSIPEDLGEEEDEDDDSSNCSVDGRDNCPGVDEDRFRV